MSVLMSAVESYQEQKARELYKTLTRNEQSRDAMQWAYDFGRQVFNYKGKQYRVNFKNKTVIEMCVLED